VAIESVVLTVRIRKYGQKGYRLWHHILFMTGFQAGHTMPQKKTPSELKLCPAVGFSLIVGGKYKLRILWILMQRPYRYGEIRKSLLKGTLGKPVTARVLSRELKELQLRGLIHRRQYDVVPPKVEYSMTELGQGFSSILEAIVEWGMTGIHEEILGGDFNLSMPKNNRMLSASSPSKSKQTGRYNN
jgi:DNA-binding HxlR family transcriptional regulator